MNRRLRVVPALITRFGGVLLGAAVLSGVVMLHAQAPGAPASGGGDMVMRAETRVVLVDAVPVDKNDNTPRDLTEKDFRIWEDGKEQKITSFSLESAGLSPDRSKNHYLVMFFDTSNSTQLTTRQMTSRFMDGFASPDRFMEILDSFGPGLRVEQTFTTDPALLKKALNNLQAGAGPSAQAAAGGNVRGNAAADNFAARDLLSAIGSAASSLAPIRGRKAMVLYSPGFNATGDLGDAIRVAIDACNQANVAVYAVVIGANPAGGATAADSAASGGGGRGGRGGGGGAAQADSSRNVLLDIAQETGGFSILSTNDLANSLGKIVHEQDGYYLLGYTPAVESKEGTCHSLKVKTDRSGLNVRARESYCTSQPVGLLSAKPANKDLEARAASAGGNIPAKMQLPWFYSGTNAAQVYLALDFVPSAMKLQKIKGKLNGEFELEGVAYKSDGSVAGSFSDTVKLDFDSQQQADAFLKAPYHYAHQFQIAPGQYNFRTVFSPGDQSVGKVEMPLNITPWDGKGLSMSGIALSRDVRPFAGLMAGLDDSLLEGPRSLVSKGVEFVPTGTTQFHAGDRFYSYLEVYEPRLTSVAATPNGQQETKLPGVGVRLRILDRVTGQQKRDSGAMNASSFMRPGNPVMPVSLQIQTADLPAGGYTMEVTSARDDGRETVVRTMDFDLN